MIVALVGGGPAWGQDEKSWGPLIAVHPGTYFFLEGGFGISSTKDYGHGLFSTAGLTLSAEVKPERNLIVAPRITGWFTILAALGLGAGYYTDFDGGTFMIQPELGLGMAGGRVTWRINLPIGKEIDGLNKSDLSVSLFLPAL